MPARQEFRCDEIGKISISFIYERSEQKLCSLRHSARGSGVCPAGRAASEAPGGCPQALGAHAGLGLPSTPGAMNQAGTDAQRGPAPCGYSTGWKNSQKSLYVCVQLRYLQFSSGTEPAVSRNRMKNSPKQKTEKHEADSTAFTIQQKNGSLKYLFIHCLYRATYFFSINLSCSHFIILRNINTRKQRKIKSGRHLKLLLNHVLQHRELYNHPLEVHQQFLCVAEWQGFICRLGSSVAVAHALFSLVAIYQKSSE